MPDDRILDPMSTSCSDRELLSRLVAIDSTTCNPTTELFDFVTEYLRRPGIRCERFDCGNGYENVWFETGPTCRDGEGLTLCGHVDTVPADEPDWTDDPRRLIEREGRLYGRGACDMKGFDAIAINLLRTAASDGVDRPLCLLLTHSEEIGTIGAGQFAEHWPRDRAMPRNVVVGEPTSLRPICGHKGHLTLRLTLTGRPCHTGYPEDGDNAIGAALPLLQRLESFRQALQRERTEQSAFFDEVPYTVLNVVRINGGNAVNIMPERCTIDLGVRLLPGESTRTFMKRFEEVVTGPGLRPGPRAEPGTCTIERLNNTPPFWTPPDDPFLRRVLRISGFEQARAVGYGTDAGRLEVLGCRSVIFGPGDIARAHQSDEWMPVDEFERAPGLLRDLVDSAD